MVNKQPLRCDPAACVWFCIGDLRLISENLGYTGLRRDLLKWLQDLYAQFQATYYSCESVKRGFVKIKAGYPLMRALAMQASARATNDVVSRYVESREELHA